MSQTNIINFNSCKKVQKDSLDSEIYEEDAGIHDISLIQAVNHIKNNYTLIDDDKTELHLLILFYQKRFLRENEFRKKNQFVSQLKDGIKKQAVNEEI